MSIDQISVNGNAESWGYLVFKFMGQRFWGFTGVEFSDKITEALGYSSGRHHAPTRRSAGKYEIDPVKVTGYPTSLQAFREVLAAFSETGTSYGSVEFEATLQTVLPSGNPLQADFSRCRWISNGASWQEDAEVQKEDFTIQPMRVARNGLVLFDDSEGRP